MAKWLIENWRSYVWVPSGEVVRGFETTFLTAFIQAVITANPARLEHGQTWIIAAAAGALTIALGYLKGKIPQTPP